MFKRGSYRTYHDRFGKQIVPRTTLHNRKRRQLRSTIIVKKVKNKNTVHNLTLHESSSTNNDYSMGDEILLNVQSQSEVNSSEKRNQVIENLETPACACQNINVAEILLMCMIITKKYALTWKALLDILEMLNCVFKKQILPTTKYMLRKLLQVSNDALTYHIMCPSCNYYFGKVNCFKKSIVCRCGATIKPSSIGSFFIEINIEDQLRKLFSTKEVVENIFYRFYRQKKNENGLEDIFDGNIYRDYAAKEDLLGNEFNFSYTLNTDGCKASDASKISVWPIYIMLHELPENIRKKYMILVGLWVAKVEPDMNLHLQPFIDQANNLSSKGFTWYYNGEQKKSKFFPLGCCVDSVARCAMLRMKKFNGVFGCTYCEHPTEAINGVRKYPMQSIPPVKRTDQSIKEQMLYAYTTDSNDVTGVKGPSALMNLKHFDIAKGMIVDFMHACLLGVTELYTTIILTNNAGQDYYVGSPSNLQIIDERLLSIRPPKCIAKVSRSIKERANWKASEWQSWLLFYSLICLEGILRKKYYNNLCMFVCAMNILLDDSIDSEMLEKARVLLITFIVNFEMLYGKNFMHYNVHLLLHLVDSVKNWGPLHTASTFPFENENKKLLQMKKTNYRIAQQIVYRLLIYQQLPLLQENNHLISNRVREFCDNLYNDRLKNVCQVGDCTMVGLGKKFVLSNATLECLKKVIDINTIIECKKFNQIIYKGYRYSTNKYNLKCQRKNDSVFQCTDNRFGIISNILKIQFNNNTVKVYISFYELKINNNLQIGNVDVTHFKCIDTDKELSLNIIQYEMMHRPCILAKMRKKQVVITIVKGALGKCVN